MDGNLVLELSILIILVVLVRIFFLVHKITTGHSKIYDGVRKTSAITLICIGSGGHTTEILALAENLDFIKYNPRYYIVAQSDMTSFTLINKLESSKADRTKDFSITHIPRCRIVNQSYITSIFTTIYSSIYCIPIMFKIKPDLILCNGPGTCIPVCVIAFLLKAAFICDTKIVFIESFCRTSTFSLSGKILIYIADNILVQWPSLKRKLKRAEYVGQLL